MMEKDARKLRSKFVWCHTRDWLRIQPSTAAIGAGLLALMILPFPLSLQAATAQGAATLTLRVDPAATLSARPIASTALQGDGAQTLIEVDIAVRMNAGATATLQLYPTSTSGDSQSVPAPSALRILLTINRNGRYSFTVSLASPDGSVPCNPCKLELKFSDNLLDRSVEFQLPPWPLH